MSELESPAVTPPVTPDPALPPDDLTPPPPPPAPRKSRTGTFFIGALSGCVLVLIGGALLAMFAFALDQDSGELSLSTHKVAIIPIEGEIFDSRETLDALDRYADNSTVKAIVIRINSPGGAIAPSQEIYSAIRRTRRDSGKPIVASMDSVAASGGYYIAAGCDSIVANPGTITASIGVVCLAGESCANGVCFPPSILINACAKDLNALRLGCACVVEEILAARRERHGVRLGGKA